MFEQQRVPILARLQLVGEPDVPAPTIVGVVAGKRVHQRIDGHVVNVARTMRIDFHLGAVGPHAQYTAAEHGQSGTVAIGGVMELGRAWGRDRWGLSVYISVVAVAIKKKKNK